MKQCPVCNKTKPNDQFMGRGVKSKYRETKLCLSCRDKNLKVRPFWNDERVNKLRDLAINMTEKELSDYFNKPVSSINRVLKQHNINRLSAYTRKAVVSQDSEMINNLIRGRWI